MWIVKLGNGHLSPSNFHWLIKYEIHGRLKLHLQSPFPMEKMGFGEKMFIGL